MIRFSSFRCPVPDRKRAEKEVPQESDVFIKQVQSRWEYLAGLELHKWKPYDMTKQTDKPEYVEVFIMKKTMLCVLCFVFLLSIAGCDSQSSTAETAEETITLTLTPQYARDVTD